MAISSEHSRFNPQDHHTYLSFKTSIVTEKPASIIVSQPSAETHHHQTDGKLISSYHPGREHNTQLNFGPVNTDIILSEQLYRPSMIPGSAGVPRSDAANFPNYNLMSHSMSTIPHVNELNYLAQSHQLHQHHPNPIKQYPQHVKYGSFNDIGGMVATPTSTSLPGSVPAMPKMSLANKGSSLQHVPCKFFKSGACTAGKNCVFSHNKESTPDGFICKYFLKGNCKFGNKCALAHSFPDRKPRRASAGNIHHMPSPPISMLRSLSISGQWPQELSGSLFSSHLSQSGQEYDGRYLAAQHPQQVQLNLSGHDTFHPNSFARMPLSKPTDQLNGARPVSNLTASMQQPFDLSSRPPLLPSATGKPSMMGGTHHLGVPQMPHPQRRSLPDIFRFSPKPSGPFQPTLHKALYMPGTIDSDPQSMSLHNRLDSIAEFRKHSQFLSTNGLGNGEQEEVDQDLDGFGGEGGLLPSSLNELFVDQLSSDGSQHQRRMTANPEFGSVNGDFSGTSTTTSNTESPADSPGEKKLYATIARGQQNSSLSDSQERTQPSNNLGYCSTFGGDTIRAGTTSVFDAFGENEGTFCNDYGETESQEKQTFGHSTNGDAVNAPTRPDLNSEIKSPISCLVVAKPVPIDIRSTFSSSFGGFGANMMDQFGNSYAGCGGLSESFGKSNHRPDHEVSTFSPFSRRRSTRTPDPFSPFADDDDVPFIMEDALDRDPAHTDTARRCRGSTLEGSVPTQVPEPPAATTWASVARNGLKEAVAASESGACSPPKSNQEGTQQNSGREVSPVSDTSNLSSCAVSSLAVSPSLATNSTVTLTERSTPNSGSSDVSYSSSPANPVHGFCQDVGQRKHESLCPFGMNGNCRYGAACRLLHGNPCPSCMKHVLHPFHTAEEHQAHIDDCISRHIKYSDDAPRQDEIACGVCGERVMSKKDPRFGLLNCEHTFCLQCLRAWRSNSAVAGSEANVIRACPICRCPSHFITPSAVWPANHEEKRRLISDYKKKLAQIPCKHFNYGEFSCPFGTSCFYMHSYRDGTKEEHHIRTIQGADESKVMGVVRLSDYFEKLA